MRKGFTLIELLAVIVILAIIALIATPLIINVIDESKKGAFKNTAYGITKAGELEYTQDMLNGTAEEVTYTYTNGVESSTPSGKTLNYKGSKPQNGTVIVNTEGKVALAIHDGTYCAEKGFEENEVTLSDKTVDECVISETGTTPAITYYNDIKGVNGPVLVTGMTPIKWDGSTWVNTTEDDTEWYDYTTKKWANVKTADGSFWVWIPRFAYSITNGYHTDTAGTIEIKFLMNKTNNTNDGTTIEVAPIYTGGSQTNYVTHPAFTFGSEEVPGIWVAKFEPSVANQADACYTTVSEANCDKNTLVPKIIPNANSWRSIRIGNAFDVSLAMKNNTSVYGWQLSEVDTHLIKNSEWGSIVYLSKSVYGKEDEVWINPNSNYITGCAGNSVSAAATTTCNTYDTANGVNASTTGNVYGVYDMSGGASERTAAYIDNSHSNLTTYGNSLLTADIKYKNVYAVGTSDTRVDNYTANSTIFGDAVYETSSMGDIDYSWNGDYSYMPYDSGPCFDRGSYHGSISYAGIFAYSESGGYPGPGFSFRPIVVPID